jgi:hypothetical protein
MEIGRRLKNTCGDNAMALAVSDKILACNAVENIWTGEDIHNSDGELYEATGTLYTCGERLCPNCLPSRSRRARKRVRQGLERVTPTPGEHWRLVTLTMPTLPAAQVSLWLALQIQARAWRLFRKRSYGAQLIRAGIKGCEFTEGKQAEREERSWDAQCDGYNVHVHLLILSRWVVWKELRQEWSACLRAAWLEKGIESGINTKDGLAVCDVRLVTNRKSKSNGTISFDGAINEVAKYIIKPAGWLKVPAEQLVEVAAVEKWPRMFELLGECREKREQRAAAVIVKPADVCDRSVSIANRITALCEAGDIVTHAEARRHDAPWWAGNDFALARQARAELYVLSELQPETLAALKARTTYLDSPGLFVGTNTRDGPRSLKKLGAELIEHGEYEKWREVLALHVAKVRKFRVLQQALRYPFASFLTLAGFRWGRAPRRVYIKSAA